MIVFWARLISAAAQMGKSFLIESESATTIRVID
jgi:hypothetical protein